MTTCPNCGEEIAEAGGTCSRCGPGMERPLGLKVIIALMVLGGLSSLSQTVSMNPNFSFAFGVHVSILSFKIGAALQGLVSLYCAYALLKWKRIGFYVLMALQAFVSLNLFLTMFRIPAMLRLSFGHVEGLAASLAIGAFLIILGINLTIVIYVYGMKERFSN